MSSSIFASLGAAFNALPSSRFNTRSTPTTSTSGITSSTDSPKAHQQSTQSFALNPSFDNELASHLDALKQSAASESSNSAGCFSLAWVAESMVTVVRIHCTLETLIPELKKSNGLVDDQSNNNTSSTTNKWVEEYLDESVKVLDMCNAVRDGIEDIKTLHRCVEIVLHSLAEKKAKKTAVTTLGQLRRAKSAIAKCLSSLRNSNNNNHNPKEDSLNRRSRMDNNYNNSSSCSSTSSNSSSGSNLRRLVGEPDPLIANFLNAACAAQFVSAFLCGHMVFTMSLKSKRPTPVIHVGHLPHSAWSSSLTSLHLKVKDQVERKKAKGCGAYVHEVDRLVVALRALYETVEKAMTICPAPDNNDSFNINTSGDEENAMTQAILRVHECGHVLMRGVSHVDTEIEELRVVLIANRMTLLNMYNASKILQG